MRIIGLLALVVQVKIGVALGRRGFVTDCGETRELLFFAKFRRGRGSSMPRWTHLENVILLVTRTVWIGESAGAKRIDTVSRTVRVVKWNPETWHRR
jgi:hypothetical protein